MHGSTPIAAVHVVVVVVVWAKAEPAIGRTAIRIGKKYIVTG
jgi:hypothetical protein